MRSIWEKHILSINQVNGSEYRRKRNDKTEIDEDNHDKVDKGKKEMERELQVRLIIF